MLVALLDSSVLLGSGVLLENMLLMFGASCDSYTTTTDTDTAAVFISCDVAGSAHYHQRKQSCYFQRCATVPAAAGSSGSSSTQ
jgi:hypothetical protein